MGGNVALVTGASRGIGAAIARVLAREGWTVAVHYQTGRAEAEALAAELGGCAVCADVSDSGQVAAMEEAVRRELGPISLLINNAGIAQQKLFTDLTDADWDRMFAVDVRGVFLCCRAVLPEMIRRKQGNIVNISSVWGVVGASCEVHYSAAKAAVIGLTKALAKEVAPSGIRVNCVAPGVIATGMNAAFSAETMDALQEETPLGRIGRPEDVAEAVAWLASERASFITGQILGVDGGFGA